ncbi:MAG: lytic transglycosylase domain-containing protein [Bdellovibrionota bacterium]|jgi:soluble lytic murein transglycosylase-like protein
MFFQICNTKNICWLVVLLVALITASAHADGKIYVYTDSRGIIRFTSKLPPAGVKARVFEGKKAGFSWYKGRNRSTARLFKHRYATIINSVADQYGIESSLIRALIHVESAYNAKAVSPKGALGLMQLMPFHLQNLGVRDPFEPRQNIEGGTKLLSKLFQQYDGDLVLILAAYNAGENAVKKFQGVPPYQETKNYVRKVMKLQKLYQEAGV